MLHRDEFFTHPGKIGDLSRMHHARCAFTAGDRSRGRRVGVYHESLLHRQDFGMFDHFPHWGRPIDQHCLADHLFKRQQAPRM